MDGYWKKTEAEEAAKKDDNDIAMEVLNAYQWNVEVPRDKVKVKVEKGWVTLEGELEWNFQTEAAKDAVRDLLGVAGVTNNITIKTDTQEEIERKDIESALARNWSLSDREIKVKVSGTKVTLMGKVDSWYQKSEAARIAWKARGVWSVENDLVVEYAFELAD